ncbi:hypothetical protein N7492_007419 [Penicillium capsulatum]|uniref:BZIP domain-containing protein n=1 Tax=Penicillium capsulatum TaxID=69766 RepID=A0A9W9I2H0_9EURO|nr:hypothetical protein N7492_007419 [Penicillium capsulatum]KAJ6117255.1 hypothetical protein N7512_006980 [Penicillium capsulatum]
MATLAENPLQNASPMPHMTTSYDQELDSFINFDQIAYTNDVARPKVALASQPSVASADFSTADARSASFASSGQSPIAFQAPSHHYEEHRQQTGLPPGALSMTYNQVNPMGFGAGSQGFPVNGGEMYPMKREEAPFDFNTAPTRNPSEMDIESDGMNNTQYFFAANPNKSQFVDPNALGGHELAQAGPSTQVGRMYPGMHQQQAAMAKAQQQKNEMIRHQMPQQQQPPQQQHRVEESPAPAGSRQPDPVVEERISRLLQQMRQNAIANGEASPTPSSVLPHMAKARKDEADMDEDERLLASEEGKKLSSKERRQLRNKVSARAFRSRRKEYIGQLEGEIASRTNEAHELRLQNRALYEENSRLNDLARMLLGSPHFANFINEMPDNTAPPQVQSHQQAQPQPQQVAPQPNMQTSVPKDANAPRGQEYQMQQNSQVSMVMAPNQGMDTSMLNSGGWNSGIDMNYGNTPVFAVLDVPEGPALDVEALSGKSSSPMPVTNDSKDEPPVVHHPVAETRASDVGVVNPDVEIDESDPAFALFVDAPAPVSNDASFEGVDAEKSSHFELVDSTESTNAAKNRLAYLCASMEAAFGRVSSVTSHLQ